MGLQHMYVHGVSAGTLIGPARRSQQHSKSCVQYVAVRWHSRLHDREMKAAQASSTIAAAPLCCHMLAHVLSILQLSGGREFENGRLKVGHHHHYPCEINDLYRCP